MTYSVTDFQKMKNDAERGYKIVDEMIWELFQYKSCATINCASNTLKILNSWTKKPKLTHLECNSNSDWCSKSSIKSHTISANQS